MSRRPNYRFSIERDREVTVFEVGIDFIKRALTGSLLKRDKDFGIPAVLSSKMPRKQSFYEDETTNGSSKKRAITTINGTGDKSEANPDLSAYTDHVALLVENLSGTLKELRAFQKISTGHTNKINTAMRNFEQLGQLRKEVQDHKRAIHVLKAENRAGEDELNKEREGIKKEEEDLKKKILRFEEDKKAEREAVKKREVDLELRHKRVLEEGAAKLEKKYFDIKKELDDAASKKERGMKEGVSKLKKEKDELQKKLEALEEKAWKQHEQLGEAQSDNENLKMANKTLRDEKNILRKELDDTRNIFDLNKMSTEFYHEKFAQIYDDISTISLRYFQTLEGTESYKVQENLKAVDACFSSIPFSNSDDAKTLRSAHVQRIISDYIQEYIWQPFSSEKMKGSGESILLLNTIASVLESSQEVNGAYISKIWSALTERALQSPVEASIPDRAEKVAEGLFTILSPLAARSEAQSFKNDILKLARSAITVWNISQTDELEIKVCSELDPELHEQWRYQQFDPPILASDKDNVKTEIPLVTRKRIFVLFPRIEARSFSRISGLRTTPPGSWPEPEAEQAPPPVETCIHPGVGLPEWSALVVRGYEEVEHLKQEEEEKQRFLREKHKELEKQWENNKGGSRGNKKNLVLTINQGPPSPTEQWKMSGKLASEILK